MGDGLKRLARLRVPLGFVAGAIALGFAAPTPRTILAGMLVALAGEAVRVWAAGHLEKSREVTQTGPYRFVRHPLYAGSGVMSVGVAIASASVVVAVLAAVYFSIAVTAAVQTEEAFLRARFGPEYDRYCQGTGEAAERRFSWARVGRNRESRAVLGLAIAAGLLIAKMFVLRLVPPSA